MLFMINLLQLTDICIIDADFTLLYGAHNCNSEKHISRRKFILTHSVLKTRKQKKWLRSERPHLFLLFYIHKRLPYLQQMALVVNKLTQHLKSFGYYLKNNKVMNFVGLM